MEFVENIFVLFISGFFVVYWALRRLGFSLRALNLWISLGSLLFYAAWYPPAALLLILHALLARYGGLLLTRARAASSDAGSNLAAPILFVLIALSLALLFFFKYYNFFVDSAGLHHDYAINIILPVGISFYTFTAVGYYVDLYRGRVEPARSLSDANLFLAFWPHLASGPILRAENIFHNMRERETLTHRNALLAVSLIATGLVKKLLIADNIGAYVNWNVDYGVTGMNAVVAWSVVIGFGAQIYADFSGYSDMAIGFALLLGFRLPANFNYPYLATSVTDFWRRWHISLSTWFRDYLYIPLGGGRVSRGRALVNILIVFVLSGIWHGAGYNFFLWGLAHGLILVFEKLSFRWYSRVPALLRWVLTFVIVMLTWAFFRLPAGDALVLIPKLFGIGADFDFAVSRPYIYYPVLVFTLLAALDHLLKFYRVDEQGYPTLNESRLAIGVLAVLLPLAMLLGGKNLPFIYFQF